jgi:hypothetical protein
LLAKLDSCVPLVKTSCTAIKYLIGSESGAIEKIPQRSYAYYEIRNTGAAVTTAPLTTSTTVTHNYKDGTFIENFWSGCDGAVLSYTNGVVTILRDMFVEVNATVVKRILGVVGGAITCGAYIEINSPPANTFGVNTSPTNVSMGLYRHQIFAGIFDPSATFTGNATWTGFVAAGTKIQVNINVVFAGTSGGLIEHLQFGDQGLRITELPRLGFGNY